MTISPASRVPMAHVPVAPAARPPVAAQPKAAAARSESASASGLAPSGSDPALWSVLTADERAFFAQGTQSVTYAAQDRGTPAPASRLGQRIDVRV